MNNMMRNDDNNISKALMSRIEEVHRAYEQDVAGGMDVRALERKYLSRKGLVSQLSKSLKDVADTERRSAGAAVQALRETVEAHVGAAAGTAREVPAIDVTLPGVSIERGTLHPITQALRKLETIFHSMGFLVLDGPELESEWYNFDALNIPATHPARDMQDTFFVESRSTTNRLVMRTHTSPVQVRAMHKYGAPLRVVSLGKVFRNEATDATHSHTFHQIEGLVIDEHISVSHLVATLTEMMSRYYEKEMEIRLRPGYFPFVEPGFEIDIATTMKKGGWMEMLGAGLVHPNVLRAGGIDAKKYSGFAFGTGVERLVMLAHGITDIRPFQAGDLHFLKQF